MENEFRRRRMPSCTVICCSLSPITSRALILSFSTSEMQQVFPIGKSSKVALEGSTTQAPGIATMIVPLVTGLLQMISDV